MDYEKARGFYGDDARSFEVKMSAEPSGEAVWLVGDSEASADSKIVELKSLGMSIREISEELGMKRSTVHRRLRTVPLSHDENP